MENVTPNPQILIDVVNTRMPFGKYKDTLLCDMPVSYLEWMHKKGFPPGKLGMMLSTVFEIKSNGVDQLLRQIKQKYGSVK
ncbi:DUF3820 family protein [Mucilaginibacter phyllosphaerae]|uniref:DUF3820 family protein n=1 Tax=Mucilaginibacter phyllosphaerae TaxID=1812349 RepID=A0A4Y8AD64_9SPHI|nr:DUF3820 family protein [Mucilaginibacter phyllosphaerae]MBB3969260.1 hypothetical protein [Mucilaginibacter phyllosphaerae]TEW65942.1 hypothetical protein E2R65_12495 [Mucilaginibacter phyllosphaerae]GGH07288.1 hypothetical protein GCM10007352_11950 [Mucilaginibacter phyllosphaerae]